MQGKNVSDENTAFQTARVSPNGRLPRVHVQAQPHRLRQRRRLQRTPRRTARRGGVPVSTRRRGALTCASCNPTGARPAGVLDQEHSGEGIGLLVDRRESWRGQWLAGSIPGWTSESLVNALIQSRYLSNEGRLFFDSADPLVAGVAAPTREEQVNGTAEQVGVENVYEYEPAGVGGCASAAGGCVALLSSGSSNRESAFLEATPTGNEVFLLTAARLSPQDTDGAFDIYDAHECTTASPCLPPPQPAPPQCNSPAECHPATATGQLAPQSPGSASFSGSGNLKTQPKPPPTVTSKENTKARNRSRARRS